MSEIVDICSCDKKLTGWVRGGGTAFQDDSLVNVHYQDLRHLFRVIKTRIEIRVFMTEQNSANWP